MEERKIQEIEFHNQREKDRHALDEKTYDEKYTNLKYYSVTRASNAYIQQWLSKNSKDKVALDYCCGLGSVSLRLAQQGAFVYGIDISDESVKTAAKLLSDNGYSEKSNFQVMDAERLTFADNTFDVIVCSGVLHHLDLSKAFPELSRVLKPKGKIICIEALGYNPAIKLYRKFTPSLRTDWEAEHILTLRDVKNAGQSFGETRVRFFHLFTIGGVLFRNTRFFKPVLALLESIDSVILKIPFVQLMAWQMIFELSQPKKPS